MVKAIQIKNGLWLMGFIVLCQAAGLIGALSSFGSLKSWYAVLTRPALTPPGWLFGPVWTLLYTMMAVSLWLVWKSEKNQRRKVLLIVFAAQLLLNALWSPLFFGNHLMLIALIDIVLLAGLILAFIFLAFKELKLASLLMIPYLSWVAFATYLNTGFWLLNP